MPTRRPYGAQGLRMGVPQAMQQRNLVIPDVPMPETIPTPQGQGRRQQAALPTLNANQRNLLQDAFSGQGSFGTAAGPGLPAVRRLMRQGRAAGLRNGQVNNFANPAFYRGTNDPNGGGSLFRDLDEGMLSRLARFAGQQQGSGLQQGGSTDAQAAFFAAFPELQQRYMSQANVYTKPPDLVSGTGTTPPNAVMGSDGKYHDPTQPLPQGVSLTPPDPSLQQATSPLQTAAEDANNQSVSMTPQEAIAAGRKPEKHLAYWHAQGWTMNPATGEWVQHGNTPKPSDPNGPQTPVPPGGWPSNPTTTTPASTPASTGWPLDPALEAQRRMIEDRYAAQTAGVPGALSMLGDQGALAQARLGTNEGITGRNISEEMASRGVFNSSLYGDANNLAATDYARQRQDLAQQLASGYSDIYGQQNQASLEMSQALQEALLNWANTQAQSPYALTPSVPNRRGPNRRRRGRR